MVFCHSLEPGSRLGPLCEEFICALRFRHRYTEIAIFTYFVLRTWTVTDKLTWKVIYRLKDELLTFQYHGENFSRNMKQAYGVASCFILIIDFNSTVYWSITRSKAAARVIESDNGIFPTLRNHLLRVHFPSYFTLSLLCISYAVPCGLKKKSSSPIVD